MTGLVGARGILPVADLLARHRGEAGALARFPTLLWLGGGDAALHAVCAAGVALSLLLLLGVAPAATLAALWALWLSLVVAGQVFLAYQWDSLLLQAGFLAIFLVPPLAVRPRRPWLAPPEAAVLLLRILLFELVLSSALVKLASGEPAWRDLTALRMQLETQPLPTWVGWLAFQLPPWVNAASTGAAMAIEAIAPFLIFGPRRLRLLAFFPLVALQAFIEATGNFAFFNLLTAALCLLLLDDDAFPARWRARLLARRPATSRSWPAWALAPVAAAALLAAAVHLSQIAGEWPRWPRPVLAVTDALARFRTFNRYGPFATLSTSRPVIVIEGSRDGATWLPYALPYEPQDPGRRPPFVAPCQPRLDFQMWVAALSWRANQPWFDPLLGRLLQGSPPVLRLFARDPFPGAPPRFVRAALYDYRFTDLPTRRRTGAWWRARRVGVRLYAPPMRLAP